MLLYKDKVNVYFQMALAIFSNFFLGIHCGFSLRNSQTRLIRKPDVCPVSEAKFRKPVLAGLRSNNVMNLFGTVHILRNH